MITYAEALDGVIPPRQAVAILYVLSLKKGFGDVALCRLMGADKPGTDAKLMASTIVSLVDEIRRLKEAGLPPDGLDWPTRLGPGVV